MSPPNHELSAAQEVSVGREILDLERFLRVTLDAIPECRLLLAEQAENGNCSRNGMVDRLTAANLLAQRTPGVDPQLRTRAAAASADAQSLRWKLAASAARVGKREARRSASPGVSADDLEQEAMLGLYAAARRFDPTREVRFGAYASWWVRAQLTRAVQLSAPMAPTAAVLQLHRAARKLVAQDERDGVKRPVFKLAEELGVLPQRLWDAMAASTLRAVETLDDEGARSDLDELPDHNAQTPEAVASADDLNRWLHDAIQASFAVRDREILARRYGFGAEVASIPTIARSLGLSAERIRQLEAESVAVLRDQLARALDV